MARTPLMAGNWKMNLNHIEAIALVQKLAYTFNAADFSALDVAVIPPFTDIRSVQTLVDGDKYTWIQIGALFVNRVCYFVCENPLDMERGAVSIKYGKL
jgi:triosephosphate isomerase